jgi:flagellar basal-body rod protein FlgB
MFGDSITSAIYQKALDGTWQRQRAISNNIANSETPGYKALKVNFEDSLNAELKKIKTETGINSTGSDQKTSAMNAIRNSDIDVYSSDTSSRLDQNNVDLESENVDMSKTVMQYYYLVRGFNSDYNRLKLAINGGK